MQFERFLADAVADARCGRLGRLTVPMRSYLDGIPQPNEPRRAPVDIAPLVRAFEEGRAGADGRFELTLPCGPSMYASIAAAAAGQTTCLTLSGCTDQRYKTGVLAFLADNDVRFPRLEYLSVTMWSVCCSAHSTEPSAFNRFIRAHRDTLRGLQLFGPDGMSNSQLEEFVRDLGSALRDLPRLEILDLSDHIWIGTTLGDSNPILPLPKKLRVLCLPSYMDTPVLAPEDLPPSLIELHVRDDHAFFMHRPRVPHLHPDRYAAAVPHVFVMNAVTPIASRNGWYVEYNNLSAGVKATRARKLGVRPAVSGIPDRTRPEIARLIAQERDGWELIRLDTHDSDLVSAVLACGRLQHFATSIKTAPDIKTVIRVMEAHPEMVRLTLLNETNDERWRISLICALIRHPGIRSLDLYDFSQNQGSPGHAQLCIFVNQERRRMQKDRAAWEVVLTGLRKSGHMDSAATTRFRHIPWHFHSVHSRVSEFIGHLRYHRLSYDSFFGGVYAGFEWNDSIGRRLALGSEHLTIAQDHLE
jgi:hypothetical protein